jgi:hypothetical protein
MKIRKQPKGIYISPTTSERRLAMAENSWEKEFSATKKRAKAAKRPIYLDFWFDG